MLQMVSKLRPLGCAATAADGSLIFASATNLAKIFGTTQYAVGWKAALESLSLERHQSGDKDKIQRNSGPV